LRSIDRKAVIRAYWNDPLAQSNDLQLGDVILQVNGKDMNDLVAKKEGLVSGSNDNFIQKAIFQQIIYDSPDSIHLVLDRDGTKKEVKLKKKSFKEIYAPPPSKAPFWKVLPNQIGYLHLLGISEGYFKKFSQELFETKALIIDLRCYPRQLYNPIIRFLNPESKAFAQSYKPDLNYPGRFIRQKPHLAGVKNKKPYPGKLIILVDERSLSRSEFFAMAFQSVDNAITIGSQTAGADGDVTRLSIAHFGNVSFSGNGVQYPDGTNCQRKGVKIDLVVEPSIQGLRQGRDEVLEKALEIANQF
ncbi:MAG: S41 family peptidase, partial [Bacteroidota bacterium]